MKLQREAPLTDCTFGVWYDDDGSVLFQTLEPVNPMPAGTRQVVLRYSPSHGYAVPGFLNVPGHSDIEMHPGNIPPHTRDCVLPGDSRGPLTDESGTVWPHAVLNSRDTFAKFMVRIGVPNFKQLTSWDDVRAFLLANPTAGRFTVVIDA